MTETQGGVRWEEEAGGDQSKSCLGGEGIPKSFFSRRGRQKVSVRVQTSMQGYLCKQIVVVLRKYEKMRL